MENTLKLTLTPGYNMDWRILNIIITGIVFLLGIRPGIVSASDGDWQMRGTAQTYLQFYGGTSERDNTFHAGYFLMGDYLDKSQLGAGYSYSLVNLSGNADISEHLFYITGRHSIFPDSLPGKLTFRIDAFLGKDTTSSQTTSTTLVSGGMGNKGKGGLIRTTSTLTEDTDINALQPIISFINFNKTFYADLGYARSRYDSSADTTASQVTPTVGFGWNDSYDWLQTRAYLIHIEEDVPAFTDDRFTSVELAYTHWFPDSASPRFESFGVTLLTGDRVFAVDPDAGAIYSTANRQKGNFSANMIWRQTQTLSFMGLVSFSRFRNDAAASDYNGYLVYLNLQHQW